MKTAHVLRKRLDTLRAKVGGFQNAGILQKQIMAEAAFLEASVLLDLLVFVAEDLDRRLCELEVMKND